MSTGCGPQWGESRGGEARCTFRRTPRRAARQAAEQARILAEQQRQAAEAAAVGRAVEVVLHRVLDVVQTIVKVADAGHVRTRREFGLREHRRGHCGRQRGGAQQQRQHDGKRIDQGEWENALFLLTSVMSHAKPDKAIVDAGLKAQSVDSGLPFVFGRDDVKYVKCSDEHGVVDDPQGVLKVNDKLRLVPGHCDPTVDRFDWYVGVRDGRER